MVRLPPSSTGSALSPGDRMSRTRDLRSRVRGEHQSRAHEAEERTEGEREADRVEEFGREQDQRQLPGVALSGPQQYAEDGLGRADHDEPGRQLNRRPAEG